MSAAAVRLTVCDTDTKKWKEEVKARASAVLFSQTCVHVKQLQIKQWGKTY